MDTYMLHARQKQLLYLLNCQHSLMTGRELAKKLETSERTVRNDILQINDALEAAGIQIQAVRGKGYWLQIGDREVLHELFSEGENKQTRQDRFRYLMSRLVKSSGWCDLLDLEEEMYISRSTLENDLKEVKLRICDNQPFIAMERNGNLVRLADDEYKKRNILIRLYGENWDYDSREGIVLRDGLLGAGLLDRFRSVWKSVLRKYQIELDDFGLIYLILASAVANARIQEGNVLKKVEHPGTTPVIGHAVADFWEQVGADIPCVLPQLEYCWLSGILEQLVILNFNRLGSPALELPMDARCETFSAQLIGEIRARFGVDFGQDERFCGELRLHIQALLNCMVSVQRQSRFMEAELSQQYPFAGEVAHYLTGRLEALCAVRLDEFNESYLLPFVVTAMKRLGDRHPMAKLRAAVVSHLGSGLTYYMMDILNRRFGQDILLKGPFPIYDRSRIDDAQPELIITTARVDAFRSYDIPVVTISPLAEDEDLRRVAQVLRDLEKERQHALLGTEEN